MIKSNKIILTQEENDKLQAKLDLVENPTDYIEVLKELWESQELKLEIDWSPRFDTKDGAFVFTGKLRGKTTDVLGKSRSEVYSFSVACPKNKTEYPFSQEEKILRLQKGSGGGGSEFQYDHLTIDISSFPLMKARFRQQYDDAFVQTLQQGLQTEYDDILKEKFVDFNTKVKQHIENSEAHIKSNALILEVQELLKTIIETHKQVEDQAHKEACIKYAFEVPKPEIPFLDYSMYMKCLDVQKYSELTPITVELEDITQKYKALVKQHAEHFL